MARQLYARSWEFVEAVAGEEEYKTLLEENPGFNVMARYWFDYESNSGKTFYDSHLARIIDGEYEMKDKGLPRRIKRMRAKYHLGCGDDEFGSLGRISIIGSRKRETEFLTEVFGDAASMTVPEIVSHPLVDKYVRPGFTLTADSLRNMIKRSPAFQLSKTHVLPKARYYATALSKMIRYSKSMSPFFKFLENFPYKVFNMDEFVVSFMKKNGKDSKKLEVVCRSRPGQSEALAVEDDTPPDGAALVTSMALFNCTGEQSERAVLVHNLENSPPEWEMKPGVFNHEPLIQSGSSKAYTTKKTYLEVLEELLLPLIDKANEKWNKYHNKVKVKLQFDKDIKIPTFLAVDGLKLHHKADVLQYLQDNNIIVIKFPAHATHLLQPADRQFIQALKQLLNSKFGSLLKSFNKGELDLHDCCYYKSGAKEGEPVMSKCYREMMGDSLCRAAGTVDPKSCGTSYKQAHFIPHDHRSLFGDKFCTEKHKYTSDEVEEAAKEIDIIINTMLPALLELDWNNWADVLGLDYTVLEEDSTNLHKPVLAWGLMNTTAAIELVRDREAAVEENKKTKEANKEAAKNAPMKRKRKARSGAGESYVVDESDEDDDVEDDDEEYKLKVKVAKTTASTRQRLPRRSSAAVNAQFFAQML